MSFDFWNLEKVVKCGIKLNRVCLYENFNFISILTKLIFEKRMTLS